MQKSTYKKGKEYKPEESKVLIVWNKGRGIEITKALLFESTYYHITHGYKFSFSTWPYCRLQDVSALLQENDQIFLHIWLVQEYARHLPDNILSISDEMYVSITRKQWTTYGKVLKKLSAMNTWIQPQFPQNCTCLFYLSLFIVRSWLKYKK